MSQGVHVEHCCAKHGCKYGDWHCPVVEGAVLQAYKCEDCLYEEATPCPSCADLREKLTHLLGRIANGEGCNCASGGCVDREWITKEIERCAKDR